MIKKKQVERTLTRAGETHTLAEWAKITGLSYSTIYFRHVRMGYAPEEVLETKRFERRRKYLYKGSYYNAEELARKNGHITVGGVRTRIRLGWSMEDIVNIPANASHHAKAKRCPGGDCLKCPLDECVDG